MDALDCVIIGYNDEPFARLAEKHKPLQKYSGTYSELKTNSVLLNGERNNYMELLNETIRRIKGFNPNLNAFELPNLAAVYLTSFLRRRGFSVEIINFYNFEQARLASLLKYSPRAVAITTTYYVEDGPIKEIIQFIRERQPDTYIIVGGPFVYNVFAASDSARQNIMFRSIGADIYITDSQGEGTLAQVLSCLRRGRPSELAFIPNLIYRKADSSIGRTHRSEENNNLDENPVDWRHFDKRLFTPTTYMRTARSCPFACAFCNYPAMAGKHTLSDLETIRAELRYLVDNGVEYMIFIDDTFNVPLPRFKKICRMMIEEKLNLKWISFFRCSNADDECFDLMQESGCLGVYLGIESGDQQILNNMAKFADVQKYKEGIKKLHDRGIITFGSFIVGYPGETRQSVLNTIEFIEDVGTTFFNVQLYFHNPIAPVDRRREEFGIRGNYYNWSHNTMDWVEGAGWVEYMLRTINNSIPLTLYGFSIWSIPYLLQKGFTLDQIKVFARFARKLLVKSFDDIEADISEGEREIVLALSTWQPPKLPLSSTESL
jgi:radical SAM PhpK family P-methyltransferase